eukprot:3669229-Prymnesium_polylepis.1
MAPAGSSCIGEHWDQRINTAFGRRVRGSCPTKRSHDLTQALLQLGVLAAVLVRELLDRERPALDRDAALIGDEQDAALEEAAVR